jgi:hypothetical protein
MSQAGRRLSRRNRGKQRATYHGYMWMLLVSRTMDDQHLKATENIILNCVIATSQEKLKHIS